MVRDHPFLIGRNDQRIDAAAGAADAQLAGGVGGFVEIEAEPGDRKSTRLNSSHIQKSRMPSSA